MKSIREIIKCSGAKNMNSTFLNFQLVTNKNITIKIVEIIKYIGNTIKPKIGLISIALGIKTSNFKNNVDSINADNINISILINAYNNY